MEKNTKDVDKLAKIIWNYHQIGHKLKKADLIMVMGSHDIQVAERGAELFFEGYAPLVLVTGGLGKITRKLWEKTEAEVFADRMVEMGVPKEKIIIESKSANTGENVSNSKKLLLSKKILIKKVVLVQKPYMERRAYAIVKKLWPELSVMVTSPQIKFGDYVDSEMSHRDVINILVGDLQRIREYPKKGYQIVQKIPRTVWKAYEKLVSMGYTNHLIVPDEVKENVLLKNLTTIKVGGVAKYYIEVKSRLQLEEAISFAINRNLKIFILGGGSDILINNKGFDGLVLKYLGTDIKFLSKNKKTTLVTAGAGMIWDDLVKICVGRNLQGIECLSGIPGSLGAAPIQNIGAYGQELKDIFVKLTAYDTKLNKFVSLNKKECQFSYRESIFKQKKNWQRYVIVDVTLMLNSDGKPALRYDSLRNYFQENNLDSENLKEVRDAVLKIRQSKFEDYKTSPNAGSFFKNPIVSASKIKSLQKSYAEIPCFRNSDGTYKCFAGWFIEKAGWKGKRLGNAQVSPRHALILLNPEGKASASEIKKLSEEIKKDVNKKFGINLEREVQFIGF